jgi:hypothetical protein
LIRAEKPISPISWWSTTGRKWELLSDVALRVFSLSATSALAERTFSGMAFIHNKLRNRLSISKVEKLHFIRVNNLVLRAETQLKEVDSFISEDEVEDENED